MVSSHLSGTQGPISEHTIPPPDNVPEPDAPPSPLLGPMAYPVDGSWPPPDVSANYNTGEVVGSATNPLPGPASYGEMKIRQGYWSSSWNDGWGQDKAEYKHHLKFVDSIEFVLRSKHFKNRSDANLAGLDFRSKAIDQVCQVGWTGKSCEEVQHRWVHVIYDPNPWPNYKLAPGPFNPIGVVTAYCGGGNTPLAGTQICDSWIDIALLNPQPEGG